MKYFLTFFICLFIAIKIQAGPYEAPNILFILTDDQRWDALGCYGNRVVRTPNFDQLASEGVRLDSFYVAEPLCCPSRASFLTGLYPHQLGIMTNGKPQNRPDLKADTMTIARYLNQKGYVTGFVGKAHLGGDPRKWGFQDCPIYLSAGESRHENPRLYHAGNPKIVPGLITKIFADAAIDFLERNKKNHWFLWFATTAPHAPYLVDKRFEYKLSQIDKPPGWPPEQPFQANELVAQYYSTVTLLDEQVGRVLRKIDELGLKQNTFVIMASDNGFMFGSHGEPAKGTWYEESARVPAMVRWPGKIKNRTNTSAFFSSVDFLPTFLELAHIDLPKGLPGASMLPALLGERSLRTELFVDVRPETYMVRQGDWKYIRLESGRELLFNLKIDPWEQKGKELVKDPKQAPVLQRMERVLDDWLKRTQPLQQTSEESNHKRKGIVQVSNE